MRETHICGTHFHFRVVRAALSCAAFSLKSNLDPGMIVVCPLRQCPIEITLNSIVIGCAIEKGESVGVFTMPFLLIGHDAHLAF
jgi:hypothetical protein